MLNNCCTESATLNIMYAWCWRRRWAECVFQRNHKRGGHNSASKPIKPNSMLQLNIVCPNKFQNKNALFKIKNRTTSVGEP